jgi:hypothetical protein
MTEFNRRDFLRLGGAAFATVAFAPAFRADAALHSAPIIYRGSERYPRIAITFDDCTLVTRLHMLQERLLDNPKARITLFPVGQALLNNESKDPGIWRWFYSRGHEFGYHGWDHTDPWVLSDAQLLQDFDQWQNALTAPRAAIVICVAYGIQRILLNMRAWGRSQPCGRPVSGEPSRSA